MEYYYFVLFLLLVIAVVVVVVESTSNDTVTGLENNTNHVPNLPFGDINIVVVTDDHSWIGSHGRKEPYYNADYGAILSFYQHLKSHCETNEGKDLWFVMNGDWIDGTALSLDGDIDSLVPLIEKMPFDIVNTGNHELYKTRVVESMQRPGGFIDWWGKRHLASNIVLTETNLPLSNRFTILEGIHSKVLVFGFIYHLENPAPEVKVLDPAEVVEERWFRNALRDNPHSAVLVMAHMGIDDPSIQPIFQAIRKWDGDDMPIQFIAGHTHLRRWSTLDPFSNAVESGRYLDTVGFISMPTIDTVIQRKKQQRDDDEGQQPKDELFRHEFVDANIDEMNAYLGRSNDTTNNDFSTEDGRALTAYIQRTKNELGLNTILGCSTGDYFVNRSLDEVDSLWAVYQNQVVPSQLETDDSIHRVIFISQASWRYDLFAKENSYDDIVAVSPFNEPIFLVGTLPCDIIVKLNYTMNHNLTTPNYLTVLPAYILSGTVILGVDCELYTHHFELDSILEHLSILYPPTDQFEVQTTSLTSTTIWTNFFQTEWPCDGQKTNPTTPWSIDFNSIEKHIKDEGVDKRKVLLFVIPSTILGMIIFCWLGKKIWQTIKHFHFRIGYSQQGPSVLDDDDEEEEIEVEDRTFTDDIETDLHLT